MPSPPLVIPAQAGTHRQTGQSGGPCVYILASRILASRMNGTLYVGVTNDLIHRVGEHKGGCIAGFTAKYGFKDRVYFEAHATIADAITREKRLKKWRREWTVELIEQGNPLWRDLYEELLGGDDGSPLSRG